MDLIHVCPSPLYLRAPLPLSQVAPSTSPVHTAGAGTGHPSLPPPAAPADHGRGDLFYQATHLQESWRPGMLNISALIKFD